MSKKSDKEKSTYFPENKKDYEYYCNIQLLKNIKSDYYEISKCLLSDDIRSIYTPSDTPYKSEEIFDQYQKLSDDFNYYIDRVIEKTDINDYNDYQQAMDMVMIVACDTAEFVHRNFILKANREFLKHKEKYINKSKSIKYIATQIGSIIYKLKSNTLSTIIMNYFCTSIFESFILLSLISCLILMNKDFNGFIVSLAVTIALFVVYLIFLSRLKFVSRTGEYQLSKYKYSTHPYNSQYKFNDIMSVLSSIKALIK